jgi:hypothetical protein
MQKRTIDISREEYADVQKFLDKGKPVEDLGRDEILKLFQVDFGGGIEADVMVCNGDRPYVGSALYNGDFEVATTDPSEELLGEYPLYFNGDSYTVEIRVKQEEVKNKK